MCARTFDHRRWYNGLAARCGGYVQSWSSTLSGESGEDAFMQLLFGGLEPGMRVLDAGCGSGEVTLGVAAWVRHATGIDFAENMIAAATKNAQQAGVRNVAFVHASTHHLPFEARSFDLVYSRRGPTSVLSHPELLTPGGRMLGVHSSDFGRIRRRLEASGLLDVEVEEFAAEEVFPSVEDFAAFWSRMPGCPDYSLPKHARELEALVAEHQRGGRLVVPQRRIVWHARVPD